MKKVKNIKKNPLSGITKGDRVMRVFFIIFLTAFALLCLYPFLQVLISSFADNTEIVTKGYKLIPSKWSLDGYKAVFQGNSILDAYGLTIAITVCGTALSLLVMALAAYALSGGRMKYRNVFTFIFYFTVLFNGGMVASYILIVNGLKLMDNFLVFILPGTVNVWNLFLLRNFFNEIPPSLVESAKIDGAGELRIAFKIILPLSLPAIVSIGLFTALGFWNIWTECLFYIEESNMYTLQFIIVRLINEANFATQMAGEGARGAVSSPPTETIKLATAIITVGPIIFLYPFLQKHFVTGLKVGGVKG